MAKDMSNDAAHSILKLHSRRALADDGRPRMTRKMLQLIGGAEEDGPDVGADGAHDELADLDQERKAQALARLQEEHPRLYGIVYLTDYRALSLRAIGRCLGLDHHTVKKHRGQAVALMRAWCADERQAG